MSKKKRTPDQLPLTTNKNFETLQKAFKNNDVALMRVKRKSDGEFVSVICAVYPVDGNVQFTPFAMMLAEDGDSFDQFEPPA